MRFRDFDAFDSSMGFYKGNLHSHTTNSDGRLTPTEAAIYYRDHGYDFLALTDHNIYSDYRDIIKLDDFLVFPGTEASVLKMRDEKFVHALKCHHLLCFPKPFLKESEMPGYKHLERYVYPITYGDDTDFHRITVEFLKELKRRGYIICYNHPVWSRVDDEDYLDLEGLDFLEIYNWGSVIDSATGYDAFSLQKMLDRGIHINAIATDDNHNKKDLDDSFGGFVEVNAEALDYDTIMQAMLDGRYYSSSGAEIRNWGVRNGKAYIECRDASLVTLVIGPNVRSGRAKIGKNMEYVEFDIPDDISYFRFVVTDGKGDMAWTNPCYLDV